MWCRGIRGATTAEGNTREEVIAATTDLLRRMVEANDIRGEDLAGAIFTTTADLDAEFPALAARLLGWNEAALMCAKEMDVPGSLPKCIRVLLLVNTEKKADEIVHVYIKGAKDLRKMLPGARSDTI